MRQRCRLVPSSPEMATPPSFNAGHHRPCLHCLSYLLPYPLGPI
jgi:hypothetical protein